MNRINIQFKEYISSQSKWEPREVHLEYNNTDTCDDIVKDPIAYMTKIGYKCTEEIAFGGSSKSILKITNITTEKIN